MFQILQSCRLCLCDNNYIETKNVKELTEKIKDLFDVLILKNDKCSTKICKKCFELVTQFSKFKNTVMESQKTIQEHQIILEKINLNAVECKKELTNLIYISDSDNENENSSTTDTNTATNRATNKILPETLQINNESSNKISSTIATLSSFNGTCNNNLLIQDTTNQIILNCTLEPDKQNLTKATISEEPQGQKPNQNPTPDQQIQNVSSEILEKLNVPAPIEKQSKINPLPSPNNSNVLEENPIKNNNSNNSEYAIGILEKKNKINKQETISCPEKDTISKSLPNNVNLVVETNKKTGINILSCSKLIKNNNETVSNVQKNPTVIVEPGKVKSSLPISTPPAAINKNIKKITKISGARIFLLWPTDTEAKNAVSINKNVVIDRSITVENSKLITERTDHSPKQICNLKRTMVDNIINNTNKKQKLNIDTPVKSVAVIDKFCIDNIKWLLSCIPTEMKLNIQTKTCNATYVNLIEDVESEMAKVEIKPNHEKIVEYINSIDNNLIKEFNLKDKLNYNNNKNVSVTNQLYVQTANSETNLKILSPKEVNSQYKADEKKKRIFRIKLLRLQNRISLVLVDQNSSKVDIRSLTLLEKAEIRKTLQSNTVWPELTNAFNKNEYLPDTKKLLNAIYLNIIPKELIFEPYKGECNSNINLNL